MPAQSHDEAGQVSALIGAVYDAALDPDLWTNALQRVAGFVPGCVANIFSQDAVNRTATRYFSWGDDLRYTNLYFDKFAATNPTVPPLLFRAPGEVVGMYELIPYEEIRQTGLYKEYMQPQGYVDCVACVLDKSATTVSLSVVIRHERDGRIDDEALRRMGLVAPHIRRALLIGKVLDHRRIESSSFAETIDGFAAGVFLVDAQGALVHANASGRAMLDAGEPLTLVHGDILAACDPTVALGLRETFSATSSDDLAGATGGISVPLKGRGNENFIAHFLPLASGMRREAGLGSSAAGALFVRKATLDLPIAIKAATQLYGITPAEAKVLRALIEEGSAPAVARLLGISLSTVKRHLEHLFAKTGTRGQIELVRLIAGFDSPVRKMQQK